MTAADVPIAVVMWVTLYFGYHEAHCLIPKYGSYLLYFRRFIDDIFGIWLDNGSNQWVDFCNDINNFGILTWEINKPSNSVDFLDLTLTIKGSKIVSKTYQKAMNLYLYLPAVSAHPRSCLKGTTFGLVRRYYAQNTLQSNYIHYIVLLYRHLMDQGWEQDVKHS